MVAVSRAVILLMFRFLKDLAWNTGTKFVRDGCQQMSAGITYYVLFSIFPFLILLGAGVGLFLDEEAQQNVVDEVLKVIPLDEVDGREIVENAVAAMSGREGQVAGLIAFGVLLWSSSSMFGSIRRALNMIYREPEYSRPWFQQKAVDLVLVAGLALFFVASVAASTILRVVQARSEELAWAGELSDDLGVVWTLLAYAVPFVFSLMAFIVLYTLVPSRMRNLGNAWPGALAAAVLFEVVKFGFSFYVTRFRDFDVVYGSLGAVMTFLFWLYLCSNIMLAGAEVAVVYGQVKSAPVRQPRLSGMGVPLHLKIVRAARSLFVHDSPPTTPR